jgi:murein DD-endopeptidase MepM/ murein hydrolase activator NlpD
MIDLGAPARRTTGALSALLAPVAMTVGALGLLGLWALAPHMPDAAAPDLRPAIRSSGAAGVAAAHDPALGRFLVSLGAPVALAQPPLPSLTTTASQTQADLRAVQTRMILAVDQLARARLASDSAAFRATGLNPRAYMTVGDAATQAGALKDPRQLAVRLDVDPALARQAQQTAQDLIAARTLDGAMAALPRAIPVADPVRSSGFGVRIDPFTHVPAFHPGQDFSGHYGEAIHVTAPGVVSFVGQRTGYGNCVEVDHGFGFKTRYGHLSRFTVGVGAPVKTGDVIGRMGSTGRSTGVHLHYEVWASGHLENPARFLTGPTPQQRS